MLAMSLALQLPKLCSGIGALAGTRVCPLVQRLERVSAAVNRSRWQLRCYLKLTEVTVLVTGVWQYSAK